jgi:Mg2+/Co2+ transporter CorC
VVVAITALSVVVGELVPKRLALSNPEPLASWAARPLDVVAFRFSVRLSWLLDEPRMASSGCLASRDDGQQAMTEEEVRFAIAEGTEAGVIDEVEEEMIHGVLELADRSVASIMTPRPDVYWIDLDDEADTIARDVMECPYSRIVIARDGDMSHPLGVVQKKDLVSALIRGEGINLEPLVREPSHVPEGIPAMRMLQIFRTTPLHIAFVFDEYGDFQGLVTLTDIMSAVAGELPEEHKAPPQELVKREDGSWLVDGRAAIDEVKDTLGLRMETTATSTRPQASLWRFSPAFRPRENISKSMAGGWRSSIWTETASTSCYSSRRTRCRSSKKRRHSRRATTHAAQPGLAIRRSAEADAEHRAHLPACIPSGNRRHYPYVVKDQRAGPKRRHPGQPKATLSSTRVPNRSDERATARPPSAR